MTDTATPSLQCLLYHGPDFDSSNMFAMLDKGHIELRPANELLDGAAAAEDPSVLIVDRSLVDRVPELAETARHVVIIAADADADALLGESELGEDVRLSLAGATDARSRLRVLKTAFRLSAERLVCGGARAELAHARQELSELYRIGQALMTERDRRELIRQILDQAMTLTTSDLGVIFLRFKGDDGTPRLRFKRLICRSIELPPYRGFTIGFDTKSTAGYAALTKQPQVIDDVHDMPPGTPYEPHSMATDQPNYWIKSMVTIPMIGQDGNVVGVLMLGNRKTDPDARIHTREDADAWVLPYSARDVQLVSALAGQAAVAMENLTLVEQIEQLFDSFVKASVIAIDQRDPTTAGHSIRVAMLTMDLARALHRVERGPYRDAHFTDAQMRELRYAALLHDFGKIGVREDVLMKSKKLPAFMTYRVEDRFDLIHCTMSLEYERQRAQMLENGAATGDLAALEQQFRAQIAELDRFRTIVRDANEPTILHVDASAVLGDIAEHSFERADGRREPFLTPDELHYLRVPYGSLDATERLEVQAHAAKTFNYLSHISWLDNLNGVPHYASLHHEKLNGTGYPNHLLAKDIPVQARLITVADIFDALTAHDRPYKRAVSPDAALDIIQTETESGMLDPDIVQIMIDGEVYRRVIEEDWRKY